MGMTIDEAIENMHAIQAYYNDEMQDGYVGFAKEDNESVNLSVEIMRKYQKITEIMSELNGDFYGSYLKDRYVLEKICEVLEDGNNTTNAGSN